MGVVQRCINQVLWSNRQQKRPDQRKQGCRRTMSMPREDRHLFHMVMMNHVISASLLRMQMVRRYGRQWLEARWEADRCLFSANSWKSRPISHSQECNPSWRGERSGQLEWYNEQTSLHPDSEESYAAMGEMGLRIELCVCAKRCLTTFSAWYGGISGTTWRRGHGRASYDMNPIDHISNQISI